MSGHKKVPTTSGANVRGAHDGFSGITTANKNNPNERGFSGVISANSKNGSNNSALNANISKKKS